MLPFQNLAGRDDDHFAEGIIEAVKTVGVAVPVVVRLQGTNRDQAAQLLADRRAAGPAKKKRKRS